MQAQAEKTTGALVRESGAEMLSIEANGVNLAYVEQGEGQPAIFVHGGFSDYRSWASEIGPFSQHYHVVAYSRRCAYPNHWTRDDVDSSVSTNADDLAALIGKLGLAPAHLIGHSYGGFIALYCAFRNPDLVRTLVLGEPAALPLLIKNPRNPLHLISLFVRSPSTAITLMKFARKRIIPAQQAVRRGDYEKAMRVFLDGVQNKEGAFEQLPTPVRAMFMNNAESLKAELDPATTPFARKDAHHVLAPTLLVKGELSPKILHRIVDILADCLPNNEVFTIPGVAHVLQLEKPQEFNSKVLEFLGRHS